MSDSVNKSEQAFRELVRVLENAVRAGANSVGLEREGGDLMVVHYFGSRGQAEAPIPKEVEQAVLEEIVSRAGLVDKPRGEMRLSLLGAEYKVVVDERESFGESGFNLTLKKRSGGGKGCIRIPPPI
jgi:hypothetical protein